MMTSNQPSPAIPHDEEKFSYSGDPLLEQAQKEAVQKGIVDPDIRVTDVDYGHGPDIRISGEYPDGTKVTLLDVRRSVHHALNEQENTNESEKVGRTFHEGDIVHAKDSSGKITSGWEIVKNLGRDTYQLANTPNGVRGRAIIVTATAAELKTWMREYKEMEAAKPRVFKPGENVNVLRNSGAMENDWYILEGPFEVDMDEPAEGRLEGPLKVRMYVVVKKAEPESLTKSVYEEELREWNKV